MRDGPRVEAGLYDHLIDAEREAMSRSGAAINKIALIKALREASGLGLKQAKDAVEDYLRRKGGEGLDSGGGGFLALVAWLVAAVVLAIIGGIVALILRNS